MSTSRALRKRALQDATDSSAFTGNSPSTLVDEPPLRRPRYASLNTSSTALTATTKSSLWSAEVATLQAELEHERSLRALERKQTKQVQQRLERQVQFAVQEANDAKELLDQVTEESEQHMLQLRQARQQAQAELREVQAELDEERAQAALEQVEDGGSSEQVVRLQAELQAQKTEKEKLHVWLEDLQEELHDWKEKAANKEPQEQDHYPLSSEAPPAVLQELHKVRIQLAEKELECRQMRRLADDWKHKAKQNVLEREAVQSSATRATQLEQLVQKITKHQETLQAQVEGWKDFGSALWKTLLVEADADMPMNDMPPEISVIQRHWNELTRNTQETAKENKKLLKQLEASENKIQSLQASVRELESQATAWKKEQEGWEERLANEKKQRELLQTQEAVWKREAESLRSIVKTFDELPLVGKRSESSTSATEQLLETSLKAAKEQVQLFKDGQSESKKYLDKALSEKAELQKTHNRVLEKFGKLKDAVYAERAKVEKAEARACRAEELAGKGSFNPETTRVLHLQQNPLTEALRQEVSVLKRRIQVLSASTSSDKKSSSKTSAAAIDVDPNKLHKRLKESFKEQIGRFREGVYLMTGYKIDMIPDNERPKFKVRSLFAEREEDHLMFQWPEGKDIQSLDLLDTKMAKVLTTTPSYEYVTRFHSLPAFLASVQLSLFEKQTMM